MKIMVFISDVQNYIPIKLCKTAGSRQLFKITGMLKVENIKLNKKLHMGHIINRLERSHCDFQKKIKLPRVVMIKHQDKIKVRHLIK